MSEQDDCQCEVPCWSGVWFEIEGHGYMEVSDLDERHHRPPEGWELASVDVSLTNSSQIFRYVPVRVERRAFLKRKAPGLATVMVGGSGMVTIALPIIEAMLRAPRGILL
jgi:hypothetical protein